MTSITRAGNVYEIEFKLTGIAQWDNWSYHLVGLTVTDGHGEIDENSYYRTWTTGSKPDEQYVTIRIPYRSDYADPLTFDISNYPAYISKPFEVKIK